MIECKIDGHVAVVTLNNPSANTFTAEGLLELGDATAQVFDSSAFFSQFVTCGL